jgi:hypothetical protein
VVSKEKENNTKDISRGPGRENGRNIESAASAVGRRR